MCIRDSYKLIEIMRDTDGVSQEQLALIDIRCSVEPRMSAGARNANTANLDPIVLWNGFDADATGVSVYAG